MIVIPGNFTHLNDIIVANNIITGDRQVRPGAVYQIGIRAHGGSRILVTGNNIGLCANDGINLEALAPLMNVSVANNLCWANGGRSIAVVQKYSQVINASISGNYCLANGQHASIEVIGRNISVTDNILIDSTGPAIHASGSSVLSHDILIARNRIGRTTDDTIVIDPGVSQAIIHDNHSNIPNPTVLDNGSGSRRDQAFLERSRSYQPTTLQSAAQESQILPNAYNIRVAGLEGPVTLLTAPTIPAGLDGQMLCILGTSDDETVTIQDQSVLLNSGLGLGAPERALGRGDILTLRYDEADATWWEVSFSDKPALMAQQRP